MKEQTLINLCNFLSAWDQEEASDGAWWAMLEEGVQAFNKENNTNIDPNTGVHKYIGRIYVNKETLSVKTKE